MRIEERRLVVEPGTLVVRAGTARPAYRVLGVARDTHTSQERVVLRTAAGSLLAVSLARYADQFVVVPLAMAVVEEKPAGRGSEPWRTGA